MVVSSLSEKVFELGRHSPLSLTRFCVHPQTLTQNLTGGAGWRVGEGRESCPPFERKERKDLGGETPTPGPTQRPESVRGQWEAAVGVFHVLETWIEP